jgi:hypothetical protein
MPNTLERAPPTAPPIPCPKCGHLVKFEYTLHGVRGVDLYTFECAICGYAGTSSKPIVSAA